MWYCCQKYVRSIFQKTNISFFTPYFFSFGEITFGRVAVQLGTGAYFFRTPADVDLSQTGAYQGCLNKIPWVYEKIGLKIGLGKQQKHFAGLSLRTHLPVADYMAFTYGYRFWRF